MKATPNEPALNLDAICALCGKPRRDHRAMNNNCPQYDTVEEGHWVWHPTNRFTPARPETRAVGAKHTPTSWLPSKRVNRCFAIIGRGEIISGVRATVDCAWPHEDQQREQEANAAHIVHCVNTLPIALNTLNEIAERCYKPQTPCEADALTMARAALAAAKDGGEVQRQDARTALRMAISRAECAEDHLAKAEAKLEAVKRGCEKAMASSRPGHAGALAVDLLAIINRTES